MLKQQFANYEDKKVRIPVTGNKVRFGVVSDTHLGSRYCQVSFLRWFYAYIKSQGAKFVLHSGDLTDGDDHVYRGQVFETCAHGFDEQLEYAVKNYPSCIPTYFILGNHDSSHFERGGGDIGKALASKRADLHYLGQMGAYVYFNQVKCYLVHCAGSPPYAITYRAQKLVEAFSTENKPNLMVLGHHHQQYQVFIRNCWCLGGSGFQGQTPFLRRKAVFPVIGGYLIEIETNSKGVARFKFEFIPLYKPKSNDF